MPGALPAVTVPIVASPRSPEAWLGSSKAGLRRAERLERRVAPGPFVDGHDRLAALCVAERDRGGLGIEATGVDGGDGLLVARERECVLVLAADAVLDRDTFGVGAHVAVLDRAPQPVVDGRVDQLTVAEAEAEPGTRDEVRRLVHRLHAARDDGLGVAGADLRGGEHDRLQAGAADPIDGRGARSVRQTRLEERLAGRGLPDTRLQDLAHEDLVDLGRGRVEAGALDGGADRNTPEFRGRDRAQRAAELADRRPRGAHDEDAAVRAGVLEGHARNLHRSRSRPGRRATFRPASRARPRRSGGGSGSCPRRSGRPWRRA